jgi:TolB-like protein
MADAPDIFLSYNREDQATAKRFAEGFEGAGLSVWWDVTLRSGEAYDRVTEQALKSARAVVVLWSPRSVESRWVRAEATLADRNRTLVPARIEACDLPIMFELTQTADLSHWQGEAGDPVWRAFLGDVRRMVGAGSEPAAPVPPSAARQPERDRRPSIAILPFVNRSGLAEDDIFADGMVEDLTTALTLGRRMKVIASSATAAYRTCARDLRQIGEALGVRYLLEGNVRRVGENLRVTAQLVEAADGDILWTQKFDRPLAELANLQEELITEVAAHLGVQVQRAEIEHALRKPDDLTAWEAVMRAEAALSRNNLPGTEIALAEARRAVAIDPGYDAAHAMLIIALCHFRRLRGGKDDAMERELREVIDRALALDSGDGLVMARIAHGLSFLGKLDQALALAERSVAINPNLETPRIQLGEILIKQGRLDEALAQFETSERLAPDGLWSISRLSIIAVVQLRSGRFEKALEAIDRSLHFRPAPHLHNLRALCLAKLGRRSEAQDAIRNLRDMGPEFSRAFSEGLLTSGAIFELDQAKVEENVTTVRQLWDEIGSDG